MKQLFFTLIAFILVQSLIYAQNELVINEVLYFQDNNNTNSDRDHEWLELFNGSSDTINLENWTLGNRDAQVLATLPNIDIPDSAYLVIHFKQGIDDFDFSDGEGDFFTQHDHLNTDYFSESLDEVALYEGNPNESNLRDFLAWKASDIDFQGGQAYDQAVSAGLWSEDHYFNSANASNFPGSKVLMVEPGTSIGRDQDSNDTNDPDDWAIDGGRNAIDISPGRQNYDELPFLLQQKEITETKEWTFMVYVAGDNDLEKYAWKDFNEMEVVDPDDEINVVLMIDFHPDTTSEDGFVDIKVSKDNGNTFKATEGTYRGFVLNDTTNNNERAKLYYLPGENADLGEKNMGDPAVLTEFITWGMTKFPAKKYAVVIWDHGLGWKASTWDDTSEDELHMGELDDALSTVPNIIDLLGFDQCHMAMIEVAYQVYAHADVLVASEELENGNGWPYDSILTHLKNKPAMSPQDLGRNIVSNFQFYYDNIVKYSKHTLSAIDLNNQFLDLVDLVSDFGEELTIGIADYRKHYDPRDNVQMKIREALLSTEKFDDHNFIDLSDFAKSVKDNSGIPTGNKKNAQPIMKAMALGGGVVLARANGPVHKAKARGLSIYFPEFQTKKKLKGFNRKGKAIYVDPYDHPSWSFITDQKSDRVKYASDPDDCIPNDPPNHPLAPTPNFHFPQDTKWDEFLHRYYEPVADAGADQVVFIGQPFVLLGSGSSDADGVVERYFWDLDHTLSFDSDDYDRDCLDENNDDRNKEGMAVTHTYWLPGEYCVTLSVWDDHHLQADHSMHQETDQDDVKIVVLPYFWDSIPPYHEIIGGGVDKLEDGNDCYNWTLGEIMVESYHQGEVAICQGFHQGTMVLNVEEKLEEIEMLVFPNPTQNFLNIKSDFPEKMNACLMDLTGKVLIQKSLSPSFGIASMNLSALPASMYFLRMTDEDGKLIATYKVQKIN